MEATITERTSDRLLLACTVIGGACVVVAMVCDFLIKHGYQ